MSNHHDHPANAFVFYVDNANIKIDTDENGDTIVFVKIDIEEMKEICKDFQKSYKVYERR